MATGFYGFYLIIRGLHTNNFPSATGKNDLDFWRPIKKHAQKVRVGPPIDRVGSSFRIDLPPALHFFFFFSRKRLVTPFHPDRGRNKLLLLLLLMWPRAIL